MLAVRKVLLKKPKTKRDKATEPARAFPALQRCGRANSHQIIGDFVHLLKIEAAG
eukprot:m.205430 g.205430  ORF g.205430 m.205430 type:complete len:55 (+) comp15410_c0_seq8:625-789(+)